MLKGCKARLQKKEVQRRERVLLLNLLKWRQFTNPPRSRVSRWLSFNRNPLASAFPETMVIIFFVVYLRSCRAWQRWPYVANATNEWKSLWKLEEGPGRRRGHSMILFAGSRILMFGGRSTEVTRQHVPKTYRVAEINGSIEFLTYDEEPVRPCDTEGSNNSNSSCDNTVTVGLYFNDVWSYELNCTRFADRECLSQSWEILDIGAFRGGCRIVMGRELCTHPSERWLHGAAIFDDATMLIYGGFSQQCEDYCDDLWSFDLRDNSWMEIEVIGGSTGPGKRWKFSMVADGVQFFIFGGFRLWHGFADDNSEANRWESRDLLPTGGFLNDMWRYRKRMLEPYEPVPTSPEGYGNWTRITAEQFCKVSASSESWAERNSMTCTAPWPRPRAGHVAALDKGRGMYIFGGYATYFPYLSTGGPGFASGVIGASTGVGFTPYPDAPFYLDDLWFYNFTSGYWTEISVASIYRPEARSDLTMVLVTSSLLVLFGGFNSSHFFDDTWYFNATSQRFLRKDVSVYPMWPRNCTDDTEFAADPSNECFTLLDTQPIRPRCLRNSDRGCRFFDWYEPDPNNTEALSGDFNALPFYGLLDKDDLGTPTSPATGEPIVPFAATGPRQTATGPQWWNASWLATHANDLSSFFVEVSFDPITNATIYSGTYYRRCTSVAGEPTRDTHLDGLSGRANSSVWIPQPRRRAPGWDGCRDACCKVDSALLRTGENIVCPSWAEQHAEAGLQYFQPNHRADHAVVYVSDLAQSGHPPGEIYIYGGVGLAQHMFQSTATTNPSAVLSDMWRLGVHDCANNCSNQGECYYGFCLCYPGFYGVDCSNISCPGDFCYYDEHTNQQVCQHCCQAGYNHTDNDIYLRDTPKVPCSFLTQRRDGSFGESNGICDGFGTCQCAPPFVLDDCSVRDCVENCSFRGYCSVEFPVSRCICHPGYYGEYCQYKHCLNNCTYPNGHCNHTTGLCTCEMMYSPYNNSREYHPWQGEDCSFLLAYCAACRRAAVFRTLVPIVPFFLCVFFLLR